ncbi:MAG: alpha/beta fold hydrolase [Pseudonocardiaceae bacterium]|nr:alpha/beta fold hydrolase [Pseudonocardiaceae bacterium]
MDQFTRDGLTFDVSDSGPAAGEPVVLLHGFPETSRSFDEVVPPLNAAGYRTVAPDQRGYSPRARPAGRADYRMSELVADVAALADAGGFRRFHLVGHDWGGAVAWACGVRLADRLASLTVLSTPHPGAFLRALRGRQALHSWYMGLFQLPWLPERLLTNRRLFVGLLVRSGLPERYARRYAEHLDSPEAVAGGINWYRAMALPSTLQGARARVPVPTLYVYSTGDRFLTRDAAAASRDFVSGDYRFEVLDGVSHWIPEEVPERLSGLLLEQFRAHPV